VTTIGLQPIPKASDIICTVADYYGVKPGELTGARRMKHVTQPRMIAMYLMRRLRAMSFLDIGHELGHRHHTTVMHGVRVIAAGLQSDDLLARRMAVLKDKLLRA
jgi:chromosomal replication initiator protein